MLIPSVVWRLGHHPPSTNGGAHHDTGADHHQILDDVLPFERRCIREPGKNLMRKQDERRQRAEHLYVEEQ